MSAVDFDTGQRARVYVPGDQAKDRLIEIEKLRYRGWILIGLGLGSWAGFLKLCGWL